MACAASRSSTATSPKMDPPTFSRQTATPQLVAAAGTRFIISISIDLARPAWERVLRTDRQTGGQVGAQAVLCAGCAVRYYVCFKKYKQLHLSNGFRGPTEMCKCVCFAPQLASGSISRSSRAERSRRRHRCCCCCCCFLLLPPRRRGARRLLLRFAEVLLHPVREVDENALAVQARGFQRAAR